MKNLIKTFQSKTGFSIVELLVAIVVLAVVGGGLYTAFAADLTYPDTVQSGDSQLIRDNKQAVAITRLEYGNAFLNTASNGTNNISGPLTLDKVIIATGGTASTLTLTEVTASATNNIAVFSSVAQASLPVNLRISGTLRAVTAGDAPANVVLSYR